MYKYLKNREFGVMIGLFVCCCGLTILFPVQATANSAVSDLVLYDDFRSKYINPEKWTSQKWDTNELESIREIESGRFHLLTRSYGSSSSDYGLVRSENLLLFTNQSAVTSIKATVRVKSYQLSGCSANPDSEKGYVRARLRGLFFNSSVNPDSCINDVGAAIRLIRHMDSTEKSNILNVEAGVWHCTNSNCTTDVSLGSVILGTVKVGQNTDIRMTWDKEGSQFLFQLNKGSEIALAYDPALDVSSPFRTWKGLDLVINAPNCQSDTRGVGFMDVLFDNVYTNPLE